MSLFKWILCAIAVAAASLPAYSRAIPNGWSLHRRADPNTLVPLKFKLAQSNVHNLDAYLLDISDPSSPNYGKHWTPSQVAQTFRPSQATIDAVHAWLLTEHGLEPHRIVLTESGGTLRVDVTTAEAERILGAEYNVYQHAASGRERVGCHEGYALPEHVSKHVDFVSPTVHFGASRMSGVGSPLEKRVKSAVSFAGHEGGIPKTPINATQLDSEASGCDTAVTLDCLRDLYNFHYDLKTGNTNNVSVFELQGEGYQTSDLDMFFQQYAPDQVGKQPNLVSIDGGNLNNTFDLGEATLDIELMMGLLGSNITLQLYQIGEEIDEELDEFLAALSPEFCQNVTAIGEEPTNCGNVPRFSVVSMSYHLDPDIQDPDISPVLARQCNGFGALALTGITFVASSGDGGVGYSQAEECLVNGTLEAFAGQPSSFVGQFPASCPYVTAVGATQVGSGNSVDDPETASTAFPSGGGFSNNFAMPAYQQGAVQNYIQNHAPDYPPDTFNTTGRAYPDVSANGFPIVIAEGGKFVSSGGTSASAPIFASFIAATNDARIAAGKPVVGFINPALYSGAFNTSFNDIVNGTNPACGTDGFPAAVGWDPITGLGTVNFENLLNAFLELP